METPTFDEWDRASVSVEIDEEFVDNLSALIDRREQGMVLNIVSTLHPADLATLLEHISEAEGMQLFGWLPPAWAANLLPELDEGLRYRILDSLPGDQVAALVGQLDSDDAIDVLSDFEDDRAQAILGQLEDAQDLGQLFAYDDDTAGGIMAVEYVAVRPSATVSDITEEVRRNAETVEEVYAVFVTDEENLLKGIISLKKLLLSASDHRAADIMESDVISVTADLDQEDVALKMQRYDLVSMPVVDEQGKLLGRITIDDVVDVIREEAEEDLQRMSGLGEESHRDSILEVSRGRLPWLILGLFGSIISSFVIMTFEGALEQAVILASFIPIVMSTAGNVGIQSSAIAVQGLASGSFWANQIGTRLGRELAIGLLNGISLALILSLFVIAATPTLSGMSTQEALHLAGTASVALVIAILLAASIGSTIPILLDNIGLDPALATGPFITASNDILGLLIFFFTATLLYI
jgi:magnesium transporter